MSDLNVGDAFDKLIDRLCNESFERGQSQRRAEKAEWELRVATDRVLGLEREAASLREEARLAKHYQAEAEKKLALAQSDPNTPDV